VHRSFLVMSPPVAAVESSRLPRKPHERVGP